MGRSVAPGRMAAEIHLCHLTTPIVVSQFPGNAPADAVAWNDRAFGGNRPFTTQTAG
jgi:hypothetical protein